jgi:transglutaminase-like putative cysteine protease
MKYQIIHRTTYQYEGTVTVSHHLAKLAPRSLPGQHCPWHELEIDPIPVGRGVHIDAYGNTTTYFEIEGKHEALVVCAKSLVNVVAPRKIDAEMTPPWETIRDECYAERLTHGSNAGVFRFASPLVPVSDEFLALAHSAFPPNCPILIGVIALTKKIFTEFRFDPRATDVSTPVIEVLKRRAGVCQDFAHLMLACLRSIGLPARYVSGYIETLPPAGQARLVGADASHAWVSVFCGDDAGWIDTDPTNDILAGERHITLAWGRDFSDVSPLRGVTIGAGCQRLQVAVDVIPLENSVS